jgi:hypothetical protein
VSWWVDAQGFGIWLAPFYLELSSRAREVGVVPVLWLSRDSNRDLLWIAPLSFQRSDNCVGWVIVPAVFRSYCRDGYNMAALLPFIYQRDPTGRRNELVGMIPLFVWQRNPDETLYVIFPFARLVGQGYVGTNVVPFVYIVRSENWWAALRAEPQNALFQVWTGPDHSYAMVPFLFGTGQHPDRWEATVHRTWGLLKLLAYERIEFRFGRVLRERWRLFPFTFERKEGLNAVMIGGHRVIEWFD